jgi:hypothetical protein
VNVASQHPANNDCGSPNFEETALSENKPLDIKSRNVPVGKTTRATLTTVISSPIPPADEIEKLSHFIDS